MVSSFSLNAEDPSETDGFVRIGGVQRLPHAGHKVIIALSVKTLRPRHPPLSTVSSSLGRLLSPILLEALILRTFPGFPSLMKTFPSTAFLVSLDGSFKVE